MWLKGAKSLKTFRIREQQDVKLGKDDVLSYDGCPRLGKAFQGPCGSQAQVATFTGGYHQIVSPILVRDGTYAAIQPAVRAAVAEAARGVGAVAARQEPQRQRRVAHGRDARGVGDVEGPVLERRAAEERELRLVRRDARAQTVDGVDAAAERPGP